MEPAKLVTEVVTDGVKTELLECPIPELFRRFANLLEGSHPEVLKRLHDTTPLGRSPACAERSMQDEIMGVISSMKTLAVVAGFDLMKNQLIPQ